ncbi:photosynthetic complex assembly protein PuhC [Alsobacter sp. KACC 23698]|uniref:Photosynthetic complex assembly protein PuhC n=1 Tax=Alsobacter sp. KACC 23698 TaxID=3149229 RepID=A0AAU7JE70_9HYPH
MTATPSDRQALPTPILLAAGALIGATLLATAFGRWTDLGVTRLAPSRPVSEVDLRFADRPDGGVAVTVIGRTREERILAPGGDGFLRATVRGLVRERRREGLGDETPFHLTRWSDGALSLTDPATRRRVSLEAFGPTNAQVFANMMPTGEDAR